MAKQLTCGSKWVSFPCWVPCPQFVLKGQPHTQPALPTEDERNYGAWATALDGGDAPRIILMEAAGKVREVKNGI